MPNDTFRCHKGACKFSVVFLALQSWNSNLRFRGSVAMWELSFSVPSQSSRHLHGEPLSDTMLAPSSLMKVAIHICACACIQSSKSLQRQTNLWGHRRTFSFAPHTFVNFTLIFINRMSYLHCCFHCIHTMVNNKNAVIYEKILTVAISTVRNEHIV